jgi:release factor glutamine methyltransferase
MNVTIRSVLMRAEALFQEIGSDTALLDAQLILAHVLKTSRLTIQTEGKTPLNAHEIALFWSFAARRLVFEPIAYILGKKEFYGDDFLVSKACLIPRPDTEVIVEKCLSLINYEGNDVVFDLCTGSGAIAIALLKARPHIFVHASDISENALKIAHANAKDLKVLDRIGLWCGDLCAPFLHGMKANLIVANPPYIASNKISTLSSFVRDHEPLIALDAGDDSGIAFHRRIIDEVPNYLCSKGHLVMEMGFDQADKIEKLIGPNWLSYDFFKDLALNTRGIVLQKR